MDDTTVQVYSVLFVAITVVLVYTARFFHARRGRRRRQRQLAGVEQISQWTTQSIESNRPLHLAFGDAGVGGDGTPAALAGAEFFPSHHPARSCQRYIADCVDVGAGDGAAGAGHRAARLA